MEIKIKTIYKNHEITVSGNNREELLTEIDNIISDLDKKEIKVDKFLPLNTPIKQQSIEEGRFTEDSLKDLIRFDKDGPTILFRIEGGQIETQIKGFMIISYLLSKFYNETDLGTYRVSDLMRLSRINTKNIHNATKAMTSSRYIVKQPGKQIFKITSIGEKFVVDFLKSEAKKFEPADIDKPL